MFMPEYEPRRRWYGFLTWRVRWVLVYLLTCSKWNLRPELGDHDNPFKWVLSSKPMFSQYVFPIVRVMFPAMEIEDILTVQPMRGREDRGIFQLPLDEVRS